MKVAIYAVNAGGGFGNKRARYIAHSMAAGLRRCGLHYGERSRFDVVVADVAVAYGWVHADIFHAYRSAGAHYLFWDLGYWGRRPQTAPEDGYHRLAIDDWDTAVHMRRACLTDRFEQLGLTVGDGPREARDVLVAGMSPKAAGTHGYAYGQWEERICTQLMQIRPDLPVIMRPKPNKRAVPQIPIINGQTVITILRSSLRAASPVPEIPEQIMRTSRPICVKNVRVHPTVRHCDVGNHPVESASLDIMHAAARHEWGGLLGPLCAAPPRGFGG